MVGFNRKGNAEVKRRDYENIGRKTKTVFKYKAKVIENV